MGSLPSKVLQRFHFMKEVKEHAMKKSLMLSEPSDFDNGFESFLSYLESKEDWEPSDFLLHAALSTISMNDIRAGFREDRNTSYRERLLRLGSR